MDMNRKFILIIAGLVIGVIVVWGHQNRIALAPSDTITPKVGSTSSPQASNSIFDKSRITKKPFGLYVTSKDSSVQPEKFTGYHTGVDLETTVAEANIDVPVPALFDGKLVMKKYATGYGGVVVEEATVEGQRMTIVYGHLKLSSITTTVGQYVKKGDILGVLGKGYSTETDGERKHLHLGIHLGSTINILGYVPKKSDLINWLYPVVFLK